MSLPETFTLTDFLAATDTDPQAWAEATILTAIRDTGGCLEPSTLFDGLNDDTAQLLVRTLTSLVDRGTVDTWYSFESGTVRAYLGFSVA